ncbi:MAG: DnaJ domain-containing protein [Betaproteobacteria bacterium]|nr:DnaJ domain-containing protein [Betaproteobacteria bacterium]
MSKNVYEILGVSAAASNELIDHAYRVGVERLEPLADTGDEDAKAKLIVLREAYRAINSPARRARYDSALQARDAQPVQVADADVVFMRWWEGRKTSWLIAATFLLLAGWIGQSYFEMKKREEIRRAELAQQSEGERLKIEVAKARAAGAAEAEAARARNQAAAIDNSYKIQGRQVDILDSAEARRSRELEYRANFGSAQVEMQQREQAARLQLQRATEQERRDREEQARIEREKRYYTCLNSAIALYGVDRAQLYCSR